MDTTIITNDLVCYLRGKNNPFVLPNIYMFNWESDIFAISSSDYIVEYEIKISKSDFYADKYKEKHEIISNKIKNKNDKFSTPNRFYYVVPENLIDIKLIPTHAGLIYAKHNDRRNIIEFMEIKKAPIIHKDKIKDIKWKKLATKLMYYWQHELFENKRGRIDIEYYKRQLNQQSNLVG